MIEYGQVGGPEVRNVREWLERNYRFFLCTMTFPEFGEEVITRMLEFAKPLSDKDFNYLRVADADYVMHYFWFNREADVQAFMAKFEGNIGADFNNAVADISYAMMQAS
jgi:hypothetical protein